MSVSTYYVSKTREGKFGSVFFLKQLQEAESSGGGKKLLGSMVQWIDDNGPLGFGIGGTDYAIPQVMSQPRALIKELERRKAELGIDSAATLEIKIAAGKETIKLERNSTFETSVAPFPLIPFNIALDVDYAKMKTMSFDFGEGTYSEFIPTGYVANLYQILKGKPSPAIGGELLRKNAYISQILLAKKYSVTFESLDKFSAGINAKLKQYNALPEVSGKIKLTKRTEKVIEAAVNSNTYYLVGVTASLWKNLK